MKCTQLLLILGLSVLGFSCSLNSREGIDPRTEVKASGEIKDSFQVQSVKNLNQAGDDLSVVDKARVGISKAAFNKEFLISTNLLSQAPTPMFSTLQSRIVSFILRDSKVYLMDVTGNNVVGADNIAQNLLIAQFNILETKEDVVVIDFNEGMKQIFTVGDMYASDDGTANADYKLPVAAVQFSYLDEVSLKDQALFIRQVAQVQTTTEKGAEAQPVEVRYQIKPYLPDSSFNPVKSPGFDKVGYFEANPLLLKDGSTRVYAMKWNEKKNIQFAISANTPAKYRELVKNALLYWNFVLGENKIQVTQLEDKNVTAPQFNQNIIQWVDWDSAGYAFADAHVDPRSGEVTSAQIFIPSAFTQANVPKRIRLMNGGHASVGLQGFKSARLCARDLLSDVAAQDDVATSAEAMDKAMRDYVYEVIAHELGHVLGLRHNFAGNLASNYDFKDRKALVQSYYKNMKSPEGILASSSVMEYSRFEESSWDGDQVQRERKVLPYDQMAMEFLYFNKPLPLANRPAFCTDSQIAKYADCNMSDAGRSVVSSASGTYQFNLDSLAARLLNLYISKTKLADDWGQELVPVNEVELNVKSSVKTLGVDLAKLVSLLKADTKLIAVRSSYLPVLSVDEPVMIMNEKNYLENEVNRLGGLEALLAALPVDFDAKLSTRFNSLVENPLFNSGLKENGETYSFTDSEKAFMKLQVAKFAELVKDEFIMNEIKALSGESFSFEATYGQAAPEEKAKWSDSNLSDQLAPLLLKRFELYAFAEDVTKLASDIPMKDGSVQKIELPVYVYDQSIRMASAKLLGNGHEAVDWGYVEKNKMQDDVKAQLALIGDEDKIDLTKLNKNTLKWLLTNKQLESAIAE